MSPEAKRNGGFSFKVRLFNFLFFFLVNTKNYEFVPHFK